MLLNLDIKKPSHGLITRPKRLTPFLCSLPEAFTRYPMVYYLEGQGELLSRLTNSIIRNIVATSPGIASGSTRIGTNGIMGSAQPSSKGGKHGVLQTSKPKPAVNPM